MEHAKAAPYLQASGRSYGTDKRLPTLDETERAPDLEKETPPGYLSHHEKLDKWERLGREVGLLKLAAKREGMPLSEYAAEHGGAGKIAEFLELGRELQRSSR